METNKNRVVVTVVGKDRKGIIAAVSGALSDWEINILGDGPYKKELEKMIIEKNSRIRFS